MDQQKSNNLSFKPISGINTIYYDQLLQHYTFLLNRRRHSKLRPDSADLHPCPRNIILKPQKKHFVTAYILINSFSLVLATEPAITNNDRYRVFIHAFRNGHSQ